MRANTKKNLIVCVGFGVAGVTLYAVGMGLFSTDSVNLDMAGELIAAAGGLGGLVSGIFGIKTVVSCCKKDNGYQEVPDSRRYVREDEQSDSRSGFEGVTIVSDSGVGSDYVSSGTEDDASSANRQSPRRPRPKRRPQIPASFFSDTDDDFDADDESDLLSYDKDNPKAGVV